MALLKNYRFHFLILGIIGISALLLYLKIRDHAPRYTDQHSAFGMIRALGESVLTLKKQNLPEKPIVAVITSFNNAKWVYKNLDSIFLQEYKNFRVIYLDDCSTDGTVDLVEQYIKEKNVADKITLIKNKKRALKMLNLYTIHHSIEDWDIIAQIDGDDWLAHNHVFNQVNQAYNDGCWLAYTQFETSNGYKGCNALPPYDVRKAGTFRTYKPWFMYSHLKTFYAWLFKQIQLQDLFDDAQGTFQPLNDDAYMMYPMLEMARDHISFISKTCYIFNVDPGYRPPLKKSQNNLFEEVLKRPAYPKLEKPMSSHLQQSDKCKADVILFARTKNASLLERQVQSIQNFLSDIHTIYVVGQCDAKVSEMNKHNTKITFLSSLEISSQMIEKLQDYIVIIHNDDEFTQKISLKQCIEQIEKTFAFGFFLNLNYTIFNNNNVMCQHLYDNLYAWKFGCKENIIANSFIMLCRKKDIIIDTNGVMLLKDKYQLEQLIKKNAIHKNMVGLFFQNQNTQQVHKKI